MCGSSVDAGLFISIIERDLGQPVSKVGGVQQPSMGQSRDC
jgi:hypothetical protein